MANIKLKDNNWETSGIYDITQAKTQRAINADVQTKIGDMSDMGTTAATLAGGIGELKGSLNAIENGLAIIVTGDTCATAVPSGGYAYIKNNTHGLAEGLYRNKSNSAFPTSGGTANSTVFESASIGKNMLSSGDFVNELSVEIDNIEIAAESYTDIDTQYSSYTNYKPVKNSYKAIAITGFTLTNSSTSGANSVLCNVFTYRMNTSGNLYFRIRNNATATAMIRLRVYILWVKLNDSEG